MKRYRRWAILGFFLIGLPLAVGEILLGYWNFRMLTHGSALRYSYRLAREGSQAPAATYIDKGENPFLTAANETGYALHPFVDYTRGRGLYPFRHDYFGFRNAQDLYFEKDRDYRLVVVTGGSEAAGYSHRVAIAENLEKILNTRPGKKFRVLNLAMNGYCLPQELNAYLHFAYHLRPEIVISHTGYNDAMYALMEPARFKALGLNFSKDVFEGWLPLIFEAKPGRQYGNWALNDDGTDAIVPAILSNLQKFKSIVENNGGHYLAGIQAFEVAEHLKVKPANLSERGREVFERLLAEGARGRMLTFDPKALEFHDHVHTTDRGSLVIAKAYADQIASELRLSFNP